jgi:hypothetical protein
MYQIHCFVCPVIHKKCIATLCIVRVKNSTAQSHSNEIKLQLDLFYFANEAGCFLEAPSFKKIPTFTNACSNSNKLVFKRLNLHVGEFKHEKGHKIISLFIFHYPKRNRTETKIIQ